MKKSVEKLVAAHGNEVSSGRAINRNQFVRDTWFPSMQRYRILEVEVRIFCLRQTYALNRV